MSTSEPAKQEADKSDANGTQSESQFLADQAKQAKAALSEVLSDLTHGVLHTADPRQLTHDHPWSAVGAAAVAGFAAAWLLVPSKEDQAIKKLAKIERALFPREEKKDHDHEKDSSRDEKKSHSFFSGLASEVFKTLRPALLSAMSAGITAKASQPDDHNGQSSDASADPSASAS
jgi:ElaB/YqjD/DUF883 family membrane-anchored ribosome-binding protein